MRSVTVGLVLAAWGLVACGSSDTGRDATAADAALPGDAAGEVAPNADAGPDAAVDAPSADVPGDTAACADGALTCDDAHAWQLSCANGQWQPLHACEAGLVCLGSTCVPAQACTPGQPGSCVGLATATACDAEGLGYAHVDCVPGQFCVNGACQATACAPGQPVCVDGTHTATCLPDGSGPGEATACADLEQCVAGACHFVCGDGLKYTGSSVGCRFWSVDLGQWDPDPDSIVALDPPAAPIPHAVIIANPNSVAAMITFTTGDGSPVVVDNPIVGAGETRSFAMPVMSLQETAVTTKSIRVLSNQPVVAAQFNPPSNSDFVHTSDASLLYPQEVLGKVHVAATMGSIADGDMMGMKTSGVWGYFTVVAVNPGTTDVTFTPTCPTEAGPAMAEIPAGQTTTLTLQQWQVLTVQGKGADPMDMNVTPTDNDLTGTVIHSSQPVAVFGGHDCMVVGPGNCDHLETQLLPVEAWGTEYVAAHMEISSANLYRVIAYHDGTTLTTQPVVGGLSGVTLNRGEWVEASSMADFVLTATAPVQMISFIEGYDPGQGGGSGILIDPSMAALIPTHQYRQDYPLLVPADYEADYITVIRPQGTALLLDYNPLSDGGFKSVGTGPWQAANVPLSAGMHRIEGTKPFGVLAWGAGNKVSYAYPAGANITLAPLSD